MPSLKVKQTKDERKIALLKTQKENEKVFKLVTKIISWKSGLMDGASIKSENKITPKEWHTYKKHLTKISTSEGKDKVKNKIKETFRAIKEHGGFEGIANL
ncbi:hypothetical protein HYS91_04220 [Candidatus Daviesbacteria bacterium]|nr:hypothetical protein [Candidatus Daviesbacteria bacterium]